MKTRGRWGLLLSGPLLGCLFALAAPDLAAQNPPWWDPAYGFRRQVTVAVGANTPSGGYAGYTARIGGFDTASLVVSNMMLANGNDLRVVFWNGAAWVELPRHVVDMNTLATDIRFRLQVDIPALGADSNYFLYFGNPAAAAPPAITVSNVYLWWDDATANREASYTRGRVDLSAHGGGTAPPTGGWLDSVTWNAGGYYAYSTGNDHPDSFRPTGILERDVYVECEFFHTNSWPSEMATGPMTRWTGTGTLNTELSTGNYYYQLADSSQQAVVNPEHGNITFTTRTQIALTGTSLPVVPDSAWLRVGLATWSVNDTNLAAWYADTPTDLEMGGFGVAPITTGTHAAASDVESAGQAGIWFQQDEGRFRNLLVRRYVEPEPGTLVGGVETPTGVFVSSSALRDNSNGDSGINDACPATVASPPAARLLWIAALVAVVGLLLARGVRTSLP